MNKSLSQVAAIGINKMCHFFEKWAAPKSAMAPNGEKLEGCGIILEKAANKISPVKTEKRKLIFVFIILNCVNIIIMKSEWNKQF